MTHEASLGVQKETSEIQKASQKFFSGTLFSRVLGLSRDILMAHFFGASASLAALMVAFRFSNLLRRLFGEGALHAAFVPLYETQRKISSKKASLFFIQLSWILFLFLTFITLIVMFFLWGVSKKGAASFQEVTKLSLILFPSLFFICHSAFCSSFLQCHRLYFLPAFSPVQFNLFWIGGLFFAFFLKPMNPMPFLALFIALGLVAQWALLIPQVFKTLKKEGAIFSKASLKDSKRAFHTIIKPLSLGILGTSATQMNNALDSIFARLIDLKGPAYLWYALRLEQVPLALFGIALSGALLPTLSRLFSSNTDHFKDLLEKGILKGLGLLAPCQMALIGFAPLIIHLIYQRGHFQIEAAFETTRCLRAYSLGLIFQGLSLLLASAFYAAKNYQTPLKATFLGLFINLLGNTCFVFFFHLGTLSIALSTSLSAFCQFIFLMQALKKEGLFQSFKKVSLFFLKVSFLSLMAYFASAFFSSKLLDLKSPFFSLALQSSFFLAFFGLIAQLVKMPEALILFEYLGIKKSAS